jgi:hypothetical protein
MRKPFKNAKFALQRETIRNLNAVTGGVPPTSHPTTGSLNDACPSMMQPCPPPPSIACPTIECPTIDCF